MVNIRVVVLAAMSATFFLLHNTDSAAHDNVVLSAPSPENYVSAAKSFVAFGGNQLLYTVPSGQTFVLTDLFQSGSVRLISNGVPRTPYSSGTPLHLKSGIIFTSGSQIFMEPGVSGASGNVFISGYLY